jgi:uncharacterized lipoprotein YmbA
MLKTLAPKRFHPQVNARPLASVVAAAPALVLALALLVLAGCASRASDPTVYVLKSEPPVAVAPQPAQAAPPWQLMLPVRVPDYLDRDELLLPQGANAVQPAFNHLWAEALSRSVPRVLTQDLRTLRGAGSLWTAPLGGVAVQGQLRVELLALDVDVGGRSVTLQARWSTHPLSSAAPSAAKSTTTFAPQPAAHITRLTAPSTSQDAAALVSAHRLALWQLAQAIARTLPP